jgi:hypothetical protein
MIMNNNDTNLNENNINSNVGGLTPNQPNPGMGMDSLQSGNQNSMQGMSLGAISPEPTSVPNPTPVINSNEAMNPQPTVNLISPNPMETSAASSVSVTPIQDPNAMNPVSLQNLQDSSLNSMNNMAGIGNESINSVGQMNSFPSNEPINPTMVNSTVAPVDQMNQGMNLGMNQPIESVNSSFNGMNSMNGTSNNIGMDPFGQVNQPQNNNIGMNPNFNGSNPNMFGTVPTPPVMPVNDGKKKGSKMKLSKTSMLLLIVFAILVIGCGVYFILMQSKPSTPSISITTKELEWSLGAPLSTDVQDYATVTGYEIHNCTLNTDNVNVNRMGQYDYTVTCGSVTETGKIILADDEPPMAIVREVMIVPGTPVVLEDFIVSCNDYTECSYELEDPAVSLEELAAVEGTYSINIIVSDEYDNQTTVTAQLIVSNAAPVRYMYCTLTNAPDHELENATLEVSYNYGINGDGILAKTQKIYLFTFADEESYLKVKSSYDASVGISGMIGETIFDDSVYTISVTTNVTETQLATDFNVNPFPTIYEELRQFQFDNGISCKNR